jgi:hypothetical protein
MANFKRGKYRYQGSPHTASVTARKRQNLKPFKLPSNWHKDSPIRIDWGCRSNGREINRGYPRWYDILYHTRRNRARNRLVVVKILQGADPEGMAWPLDRKPHIYYW